MVLTLGDRVQHKDTGNIGTVVDCGHRIVNNKCMDTVKVKLINSTSKKKSVLQDLDSQWLLCPKNDWVVSSNSCDRHPIVKPIKKRHLVPSA